MPDKQPLNDRLIFRVHRPKQFTAFDHDGMLLDKKLSFQARGMLGYLLSKPPHWQTRIKDLVNASPGGRDRVIAICKELVKFGYMKKFRGHTERGHILWTTIVSETPLPADFTLQDWLDAYNDPKSENPPMDPKSGFPMMGNPNDGKPNDGKPGSLVKTNRKLGSKAELGSTVVVDDLSSSAPGSDVAPKAARPAIAGIVLEIVAFWKKATGREFKFITGSKTDRNVRARMKEGFSKWEIMCGVAGCRLTPHNQGQNDQGRKYNSLELICRTNEKLQDFIDTAISHGWDPRRIEQTELGLLTKAEAQQLHDDLPTVDLEEFIDVASVNEEWTRAINKVREKLPPEAFQTWFAGLRLVSVDEESKRVVLAAPNDVVKKWIESNYLNWLENAFAGGKYSGLTIEWTITENKRCQKKKQPNENQTSLLYQEPTPALMMTESSENNAPSVASD